MLRLSTAIVIFMLLANCQHAQKPADEYAAQRKAMVRNQIAYRGVTSNKVLEAMRRVERHLFVPAALQDHAYEDRPLPIGYGQTISQPYIVAYMTEILRLKPDDRVLEIGTGSGYQAAVLAELCDSVFSMEIVEPLAKSAKQTLQNLGYKNVYVKYGDGYKGWPGKAPFDAIIVTCAPEKVPIPLKEQLSEGGKMIIPVGDSFVQELYLLQKKNNKIIQKTVLPVRFVPMLNEKGKRY